MTNCIRRAYTSEPGFSADFLRVHEFLLRINQPHVTTQGFLWGRWQWMFSLPYLDTSALNRIGIWQDQACIVGLATYEAETGYAYFCVDPAYAFLKAEIFDYARSALCKEGQFQACIDDNDREMQRIAHARGFIPTQGKEQDSLIDIDESLAWRLPEGFAVQSLADELDLRKLHRCLWRGFNHPGEPPDDAQSLRERAISLSGPHVDLALNMVTVAPNGDYAAYCGMWHSPGTTYALVEPVCTDPTWRRMGCGKAAVLEAVKRCGARGATQAFVGSAQEFYYAIGFYPVATSTWWRAA